MSRLRCRSERSYTRSPGRVAAQEKTQGSANLVHSQWRAYHLFRPTSLPKEPLGCWTAHPSFFMILWNPTVRSCRHPIRFRAANARRAFTESRNSCGNVEHCVLRIGRQLPMSDAVREQSPARRSSTLFLSCERASSRRVTQESHRTSVPYVTHDLVRNSRPRLSLSAPQHATALTSRYSAIRSRA